MQSDAGTEAPEHVTLITLRYLSRSASVVVVDVQLAPPLAFDDFDGHKGSDCVICRRVRVNSLRGDVA